MLCTLQGSYHTKEMIMYQVRGLSWNRRLVPPSPKTKPILYTGFFVAKNRRKSPTFDRMAAVAGVDRLVIPHRVSFISLSFAVHGARGHVDLPSQRKLHKRRISRNSNAPYRTSRDVVGRKAGPSLDQLVDSHSVTRESDNTVRYPSLPKTLVMGSEMLAYPPPGRNKIDRDYRNYEKIIGMMQAREDEMAATFVQKVRSLPRLSHETLGHGQRR